MMSPIREVDSHFKSLINYNWGEIKLEQSSPALQIRNHEWIGLYIGQDMVQEKERPLWSTRSVADALGLVVAAVELTNKAAGLAGSEQAQRGVHFAATLNRGQKTIAATVSLPLF
ncbi:hypothetical protein L1887_25453 [Cichorium endivia]|nr:hypothetical protein L1887_25453 [Cichorium endivia]